MEGLFLHFLHRIITSLVFCLLLTHCSRGQSESVDSLQPIVARVGDDVVLPCQIKPSVDVSEATLEWKRSNLFVLVWRNGADLKIQKHPSYRGRTSLFPDELKNGNVSLKLSDVKLSDKGTYKCYVVEINREMFVELVVVSAPVCSPLISLSGMDRDRGGVVLQCESRGWYPEPEVLWLDAEGNLLSAGPPETVRK
ncbi:butyrophilin subfamily 3 member A2-like [Mugil cephalus]|uniref:butyrophilin subfamily 3 member A2-like n=1 Tax=Mugil cephalus TaxID=48193 RepID=UPI001FB71E47|nr:butyrophilin subfamily 3 member A2-like [Mugil cephalus]